MLANKKPWGHESLAFQNENVAIWHLVLNPWEETSLHCHPNKKTGLVVLEGAAKVSFLSGGEKLFAGEKLMIRQGVFHKTKNMTGHPLHLFEIETPVKKEDLVRIKDKYGRKGQVYGNETEFTIEDVSYPWEWSFAGEPVNIGSVYVSYHRINDCYFNPLITPNIDKSVIMVVSGGLTEGNQPIVSAGDVILGANFRELMKSFYLVENTTIVRIDSGY